MAFCLKVFRLLKKSPTSLCSRMLELIAKTKTKVTIITREATRTTTTRVATIVISNRTSGQLAPRPNSRPMTKTMMRIPSGAILTRKRQPGTSLGARFPRRSNCVRTWKRSAHAGAGPNEL